MAPSVAQQQRAPARAPIAGAPTPRTAPHLFTSKGERKWKVAPPNVKVEKNTQGSGTWIERWQSPKTGKFVYNYTQTEVERRAGLKFVANRDFGKKLPAIRAQVERDVRGTGKTQAVALSVMLIDKTFIRVGNDDSAEGGHFGASTLLRKHVQVKGTTVQLDFVGKSGVKLNLEVKDAALAKAISAQLKRVKSSNQELFQFEGKDVSAEDVNAYLSRFGATAKKFRTYHATRLARETLLAAGPVEPGRRQQVVQEMFEQVAARLGHTPAVCRSNYVDPLVVTAFMKGKLR